MGRLTKLHEAEGFTVDLPSCNSPERATADPTELAKADAPKLEQNNSMVRQLIWRIIAARLFVFRMFLEAINMPPDSVDKYRDHWVHWQLQPLAVNGVDPFHTVASMLQTASADDLTAMIATLIGRLQGMCSLRPLYIVIDECQAAGRLYSHAFKSTTNPQEYRPLLTPVMSSIHFLNICSTVVAGTGLSMKIVERALESPVAKFHRVPITIKLFGAFDSEQAQRDYLLSYLPPNYTKTSSGRELFKRAWAWLRGRYVVCLSGRALLILFISRYRFTATFVELLLRDSFRSPHKVLDAYITHLTCTQASDTPPCAKIEPDNTATTLSSINSIAFQDVSFVKILSGKFIWCYPRIAPNIVHDCIRRKPHSSAQGTHPLVDAPSKSYSSAR
jgi:hypothetical protein